VSGLERVEAVAAGARHSLALTSDGAVWGWGDNSRGQVGDGGGHDQRLPVRVLTGATAIAAGDHHSIALKRDGTLWTWGANASGQLGDGGMARRSLPGQVTGLGLVAAIAGGGNHTIAVLQAGVIKAWGRNASGQLGDGTTARARTPVEVALVRDATAADGGFAFSLARRFDGTLLAWGQNASGQLGLGDTAQRLTPQALAGVSGVVGIAAGGHHALALLSDGRVAAWGHNGYGSVGDGSGIDQPSPVSVAGLPRISALGAGRYHSVTVSATGEVWVWGRNNRSQLGDGSTEDRLSPTQIAEAGFDWRAATPGFSPAPGTYSAEQRVEITCATIGATIRYTTDGSEPTASSPVYSKPIAVTVSLTLAAKAFAPGLPDSAPATASYTLKVATPSLSPGGGSYTTPQLVTASTTTSGATLRYTLDGSDPTDASAEYTAPLSVGTTTTLKVAGFKPGWTTSDIAMATYSMSFGTLAAPSFSPPPQVYVDSVQVTISADAGASVLHTTDGSDPTPSSALYTGPVGLLQTTTLKAKAWKTDHAPSAVTAGTYTLKVAPPVLGLPAGAYPPGTRISVTSATAGAGLRYTLTGAEPSPSDSQIASGGSLAVGNFTLKVRALKDGCDPSDVTAATYTVVVPPGSVAAGESLSLALLADGTVWAWGENGDGRLGDGTNTSRVVPSPILGLAGIQALAAGSSHALALASDGTVWSWGTGASGELGDGTTTGSNVPRMIGGLSNVVAIAAGRGFSAAVRVDGSLWMWGENEDGQLGLGDNLDRPSPVEVMAGVAGVALGSRHALALKTDASVFAWGDNSGGQLGDGTTAGRQAPAVVPGLTSVAAVAAGGLHSLARLTDGSSHAWGENDDGQLGDGTTTDWTTPVPVGGALPIALALDAGEAHSLAIAADESVRGWGSNSYGQVGDGTTGSRSSPMVVSGPSGVIAVAAGHHHSLAMAADGSLWAWGDNASGQLGDGTGTTRLQPVKIRHGSLWIVATPTLTPGSGSYPPGQTITVNSVTPGAELHYTTDGAEPTTADPTLLAGGAITLERSLMLKVKGWRAGWAASATALGSYDVVEAAVAAPVFAPPPGTFATAQSVAITTATPDAVIRYTLDGSPPGPGSAIYGGPLSVPRNLILSARAFRAGWLASPVSSGTYSIEGAAARAPVISPAGGRSAAGRAVRISSTEAGVTLRYTTDGMDPTESDPVIASGASVRVDRSMRLKARAWKPGLEPSPVAAADFDVVGAVAAGMYHSVALRADGTVAAWGTNSYGQLGDGTTVQRMSPVDVPGLDDVIAIAGGQSHTLALKSDGTVWSWGFNGVDNGILGAGITDGYRTSPVQVVQSSGPLTGVVAVAAGMRHSLALKSDGTVWAWGFNYNGSLGLGTQTNQIRATRVPGLTGVTAIAAGGWYSLALQTNGSTSGTLWSWGLNDQGQLLDGTTATRYAPIAVAENVRLVGAGVSHTLLEKADGSLWGAGLNSYGQLGNGTLQTPQLTLAPALGGLQGVTKLSASGMHTLALTDLGEVWATGYNGQGQIGDGTLVDKTSPIRVVLLHDVVDVAAGLFGQTIFTVNVPHSVALTADGRVWAWGANVYGALGHGGTTSDHRYRPQPIASFSAADRSWPTGDPDGDGLLTEEELRIGTDPFKADTNGDGISDFVAARAGLDATGLDVDGDGIPNAVERPLGTDPLRCDSDGDSVTDRDDCFPLDPARAACPVFGPGDATPPVIHLTEPTSAVLVSSVP
jgi:alpha-tubulin suppressor-like RCC1 family protein